jgi:signal peptidase I
MLPTFEINDRVLVNKLSYRLHGVNRGDIIVFEHADSQLTESKDLIKRAIALPGEVFYIDDATSTVYVDGKPLSEPYVNPGQRTTNGPAMKCTATAPCTVPPQSVFVMGDNRQNSRDSRYIGYIKSEEIVGRAFVRVWPLDRFGGL